MDYLTTKQAAEKFYICLKAGVMAAKMICALLIIITI